MPISVVCSTCSSKLKAPDQLAGKSVKCPKCGEPVAVPAAPSPLLQAVATVAEPAVEHKSCPFCGEQILAGAKKCKHCGETLDPALRAAEEARRAAERIEARPAARPERHAEARRPAPLSVERPARPARKVPRLVWLGGGVLGLLALCCGLSGYITSKKLEALAEADKLYANGKKAEAVEKYKEGYGTAASQKKPEILKRIVEFEVDKGDTQEATKWVEKGMHDKVDVAYDGAAGTLAAKVKKDRDDRLAQQQAEHEAKAKAKQDEREAKEKKANAPPEQDINTFASTLMAAYGENAVAADQKYKGKIVQVQGVVEKIGKDLGNTAYVTLSSEGQTLVLTVQCMFPKKRENELTNLRPGQAVTIRGKCAGKLLNVLIQECYLIEAK